MAERAKSKKKAAKKKAPTGATGSRGRVAKADNPRAVKGNNSKSGVSPALIKTHHEKISEIEVRLDKAKAAYDKIKGEHRAAHAVVKQDGIDVEGFKLARELDKRDHGQVVTEYANVGVYLAAFKSDLATQMDLFQGLEVPPAGDAALQGAHAFSNKEPRSGNPFKVGTEEYVAYDNAWMAEANKVDLGSDAVN